jgi:hypothetical protein
MSEDDAHARRCSIDDSAYRREKIFGARILRRNRMIFLAAKKSA